MLKQSQIAVMLMLLGAFSAASAATQGTASVSEDTKTRLHKEEVIELMAKTAQMPKAQQDSRLDLILKDQSGSKTPRSDYLLCTGLAYLGNYKAQECVGKAFEKGLGVIEDLSEAYAWYGIALENRGSDDAAEQRLEAAKARMTASMRSAYPAPSDDELDEMIDTQRNRIAQYQDEMKKAKK